MEAVRLGSRAEHGTGPARPSLTGVSTQQRSHVLLSDFWVAVK